MDAREEQERDADRQCLGHRDIARRRCVEDIDGKNDVAREQRQDATPFAQGQPAGGETDQPHGGAEADDNQGERDEAKRRFEHILEHGNHLNLFSENIDPRNGELTGNFPQAYTHIAIINTAIMLERAEQNKPDPAAKPKSRKVSKTTP